MNNICRIRNKNMRLICSNLTIKILECSESYTGLPQTTKMGSFATIVNSFNYSCKALRLWCQWGVIWSNACSRINNFEWIRNMNLIFSFLTWNTLHKKIKFPLRISFVNVTKYIFTEVILNGKLHFFCTDKYLDPGYAFIPW